MQYVDSRPVEAIDDRFDISDVIMIVWADAPPRSTRPPQRALRKRRTSRER